MTLSKRLSLGVRYTGWPQQKTSPVVLSSVSSPALIREMHTSSGLRSGAQIVPEIPCG